MSVHFGELAMKFGADGVISPGEVLALRREAWPDGHISQAEAEACDDYLKTQGLIVRRVAGYQLPSCLRITVGDESACRRVVHAIRQFKGD